MSATLHRIETDRLSPEDVLDNAKGELESVVVIGRAIDGDHYIASNLGNAAQVLWLMEQCKALLLDVGGDD